MSTIKWHTNGKGYQRGKIGGSTLVYRPAYGFREYLQHLLNTLAHDPKNFQQNKLYDRSSISPVYFIYPNFVARDILSKSNVIKNYLITEFKKHLETTQSTTSNFDFLSRLSLHRDWNHSCMICLEDQCMGRACLCGHTEIIIFRPCGHSMCNKPCFQTYAKTNPDTCPLCRTSIGDVFEVDKCYYDHSFDTFLDNIETSLIDQCGFADLFAKYSNY